MRWLIHWTWCRLTRPNWLVLTNDGEQMTLLCNGCRRIKSYGSAPSGESE